MFREVARARQAMTREECLDLLKHTKRGVLSVTGDDGWPYGMPLNHFYDETDGRIYFHCGKAGHRLDALRADPRASFCVLDEGAKVEDDWALRFRSVIVFGHVEFVEDQEKALDICARLSRVFTQDEEYIRNEIEHFGQAVLVFALVPEHMTGKRVKES